MEKVKKFKKSRIRKRDTRNKRKHSNEEEMNKTRVNKKDKTNFLKGQKN